MSQTTSRNLKLLLCMTVLSMANALSLAAAPDDAPIDFYRNVYPIFQLRCVSCHGSSKQDGLLRLDLKRYAVKGGESGEPILGGDLSTNEIYLRVKSKSISVRMPFGEPPLPDGEFDVLKRWVEQGCPWPDRSSNQDSWVPAALQPLANWLRPLLPDYRAALVGVMLLLFVYLLQSKISKSLPNDEQAQHGKLTSLILKVRIGYCALILIAVSLVSSIQEVDSRLTAEIDKNTGLAAQFEANAEKPLSQELFGTPPIPIRPHHQPRMFGTYYRGNDERHPRLFNHGNYLTAILHIEVLDKNNRRLEHDQAVEPGELKVRFDVRRAPMTSTHLFSDKKLTEDTVLSQRPNPFTTTPSDFKDAVTMKIIKSDEHWEGHFPIGSVKTVESDELSGLIYVYYRSQYHYGIKYDLKIRNGKVTKDSEIWLGNLWLPPVIQFPAEERVPYNEWFDYQTQPEVTEANPDDPKLIGIEEHEKNETKELDNVDSKPDFAR